MVVNTKQSAPHIVRSGTANRICHRDDLGPGAAGTGVVVEVSGVDGVIFGAEPSPVVLLFKYRGCDGRRVLQFCHVFRGNPLAFDATMHTITHIC